MLLHFPKPLVLASTSPYRKQLMQRFDIPFEAVAPPYEEEHDLDLLPDELVVELATRKARSLGSRHPGSLIIGADQVAELDGRLLLKPGTAKGATEQLEALSGRTHRLLTGVVVFDPETDRIERALDTHQMKMRPLTEEQIAAYVAREQPLDCAGSYRIEARGVALFAEMKGSDHTGIVGLPITCLVDLLIRFGAR